MLRWRLGCVLGFEILLQDQSVRTHQLNKRGVEVPSLRPFSQATVLTLKFSADGAVKEGPYADGRLAASGS